MTIIKNIIIEGADEKPIALDLFYKELNLKPVVIYAHGFNGFKDWGNFDLIARQFAKDFIFIKFNFSHNGTTPEDPETFIDLDAFGQNNYTKELEDLQRVIDWTLHPGNPFLQNKTSQNCYLIGHSMGGGIALLKASEEKRVTGIATWASIAACTTPWGSWPDEKMEEWKSTGIQYILNSRTQQQMPLRYQLYQDYESNKERLDILRAVGSLTIPLLICHGMEDNSVPVSKAYEIKDAAKNAILFTVTSDHVFGRKHPWTEVHLPDPMQQVIDKTISFFKAIS
ncbi:MAG: alpha/beta fold hydrolase [Chitinophagaceae bacterium]